MPEADGRAAIGGRPVLERVPKAGVADAVVDRGQNGVAIRKAVTDGSKERPALNVWRERLFSAPRGAA